MMPQMTRLNDIMTTPQKRLITMFSLPFAFIFFLLFFIHVKHSFYMEAHCIDTLKSQVHVHVIFWKIVHGFYKSRKNEWTGFWKRKDSVPICRNYKESDCNHCSGSHLRCLHRHLLPHTLRRYLHRRITSRSKSSTTTWHPNSLVDPHLLRTKSSLLPGLHSLLNRFPAVLEILRTLQWVWNYQGSRNFHVIKFLCFEFLWLGLTIKISYGM